MSKIHRDHNVYILGAGFSREAGLPLVYDFLNYMRDSLDWLSKEKRELEINSVGAVFDFRLKAAGAAYRTKVDVENIEELFSLASAGEVDLLTSGIPTAIAATLDYARQLSPQSRETFVFHTGSIEPLPNWQVDTEHKSDVLSRYNCPVYDMYAGILSGRFCESLSDETRNTIITFNYDTLLEDSLTALGVSFHYGIPESLVHRRSSSTSTPTDSHALRVLKLHGSVNWGVDQIGSKKISLYNNYENLRLSGDKPFLVPPTWRKTFTGALTGVWDAALEALNEATRIIIIGFSIPPTDIHFKYLLAAGLRDNISLKNVYFVNPLKQSVQNLFQIMRLELWEST